MATQDDYIRTALRVPPTLHKQLHEAAASNNRTFNAEIVARLQASFGVKSLDTLGLFATQDTSSQSENYKQILQSHAEKQRDELLELVQKSMMPTLKAVLEDIKKQEQMAKKANQQLLEELNELKEASQIKKPKA